MAQPNKKYKNWATNKIIIEKGNRRKLASTHVFFPVNWGHPVWWWEVYRDYNIEYKKV